MNTKVKKSVAAVFCAAMLMSTAACSSDTSWSIKNDSETLSIGTYIYYMSTAFDEAKEKTDAKGNDILSATIENKTGDQWIKDRAKELCVEQLTIDKLVEDNKVKVTDDDLSSYTSYITQMWPYIKGTYEPMGVSQDSFKKAVAEKSVKKDKLFEALYNTGGKLAVDDKEIEEYFLNNYTNYTIISKSLTTVNEDGTSKAMTDEEIETVKVELQEYERIINNDKKSMDDVIAKYKENNETESDPTQSYVQNLSNSTASEELTNAIKKLDDGKSTTLKLDSTYYFIYKGAIKDEVKKLTDKDDTSTRFSVLHELKDDDFEDYIAKQAKELKYEQNDAAFAKYTPSRVVTEEASDDNSSEAESSKDTSSKDESSKDESSNDASGDDTSSKNESSKTDDDKSDEASKDNSDNPSSDDNGSSSSAE